MNDPAFEMLDAFFRRHPWLMLLAVAAMMLVTAWILYTIWEGRNDIKNRMGRNGGEAEEE